MGCEGKDKRKSLKTQEEDQNREEKCKSQRCGWEIFKCRGGGKVAAAKESQKKALRGPPRRLGNLQDYDKLKDKINVNHGFNSLKENLSFLSLSDLRGNELSGAAILEKSLMPPSTALSERNGFSGVKLCLIRWPSMLLEITLFV